MAKKYDKNTWMGGDVPDSEIARENEKAPSREGPKKTRGITRTDARKQKAPGKSNGFLQHTQKGKC